MGKKRHTRYKVITHFDGEAEAADSHSIYRRYLIAAQNRIVVIPSN